MEVSQRVDVESSYHKRKNFFLILYEASWQLDSLWSLQGIQVLNHYGKHLKVMYVEYISIKNNYLYGNWWHWIIGMGCKWATD